MVEVSRPACEYFEKVLFFVKPEYSSVSTSKINETANKIAITTGAPPKMKKGRKRVYSVFSPLIWAGIGAAAAAIIIKCFGL